MPKTGNYRRGRSRENSLKYRLWDAGFHCERMRGSAGGRPGAPVKPIDLIALQSDGNGGCRAFFIQVSRHKRHISSLEREELTRLADRVGAVAVLAYIVDHRWVFESATGVSVKLNL